jgi:magnesium transporter
VTATRAPAKKAATKQTVVKKAAVKKAATKPATPKAAEDPVKACRAESPTSCAAHTRVYRAGKLVAEGFPVEQISDYLAKRDTTVWLDLAQPTRADLDVITEELGLHELAVEDALNESQRPKLDHYDDRMFLSSYVARLDDKTAELSVSEVAAFITPRALVTVRKSPDLELAPLLERWDSSHANAVSGVGFLLHGLLDLLVDGHFDAVQKLDDEIEGLEDVLFDPQPRSQELQRRSFEMRKSLVLLRRVVLPMREVVNTLLRRDVAIVDERMAPYYQDVYDHVLRAAEWTESLRDLVSTILETNLTLQGNRLNEVMKKLTAWAAILAVTTAVTGFYGQNVPYPGFGETHGFYASLAILFTLTGGLYVGFKKRGWL